jgi:hypothetical protein
VTDRDGTRARLVLLAYPPWFRERYGAEMVALVEDSGWRVSMLPDLARGAVSAWLRPRFGGAGQERLRLRRQATVATVWVAWCAVVLGTPAMLRLLEDPPPPGFTPMRAGWGTAHHVLDGALALGWLVVLVVGVPLGLRALAVGPVRRVVLPPVAMLGVCAGWLLPLQVYASRHWLAHGVAAADANPPVWWVLAVAAWALATGLTAVWGTVGFAVGLRRSGVPADRLRRPTVASAILVGPMVVVVGLVLAIMATAGPSAAGPMAPLTYLGAAGLVVALGVSCVSTLRGLRKGDGVPGALP